MKFTYLQGRKVDNLAAHDNVQLTIQILAELEEQEQWENSEEGPRFPLKPAFHSPIELETKVKRRLNKGLRTFHNYREGPYLGLHLVESDYYYDTVSQHEIGTPKQRP